MTVVMALLLTAAIPRFRQTADRLRVEQAAFAVAQGLRTAHELAIAEGREVLWVWEAGTRRTRTLQQDAADGGVEPLQWADRSLERRPLLDEGISLRIDYAAESLGCPQGLSSDSACIAFLADGSGERADVLVSGGGTTYTVTVDGATGSARVRAGTPAR